MPGVVSTIAVQKDDKVRPGDVLLTIEAMKMETTLRASRAGVVEEVLVRVGRPVEAKESPLGAKDINRLLDTRARADCSRRLMTRLSKGTRADRARHRLC